MKTMTCRELGGACDLEFRAATFDEMVELSKQHGTEMFQSGDQAHLAAMEQAKALMTDPDAMRRWIEDRRQRFENAPES